MTDDGFHWGSRVNVLGDTDVSAARLGGAVSKALKQHTGTGTGRPAVAVTSHFGPTAASHSHI